MAAALAGCPAVSPFPVDGTGPFDSPWPVGEAAPSEVCPDDGDRDGDRVADCGPALEAALAPCPVDGWACCVREVLAVGDSVVGSTDDPGALDTIDSWPGWTGQSDGPEYTWLLAPESDGRVVVEVQGSPSAQLHLHRWRADDGPCAPGEDVESAEQQLSWQAQAGSRWYVVVDGAERGWPFEITVSQGAR